MIENNRDEGEEDATINDEEMWKEYVQKKSAEFKISERDLLRIIVFCFDERIHHYLIHKKYNLLLDNLINFEVDKAIRRTKSKLPELDRLIKLRRQVSEMDLDFMLNGGGALPTDSSSFEVNPSDISYF